MALPTDHTAPQQPQMAPTPGVTPHSNTPIARNTLSMGPVVTDAVSMDPVLFDDIDPVLLAKVYPDATDAQRAAAVAAGKAAQEAGRELHAAQQEPVTPPPADMPKGGGGAAEMTGKEKAAVGRDAEEREKQERADKAHLPKHHG